MYNFKNYVNGFTLAEVLITLSIIGVVAALTIPSVINNVYKKQLEIGFKKSYSTISQALEMYYAENGERITSDIAQNQLYPILIKHIKTVKECGIRVESCVQSDSDIYQNYNATNGIRMGKFISGQFIINDGSLVLLENSAINNQVFMSIDVNGYNKKPNRLGHDLFMFQINNNGKLLPMGLEGTDYLTCSKDSTSDLNGAGCTAKAVSDKDYFKNLPK